MAREFCLPDQHPMVGFRPGRRRRSFHRAADRQFPGRRRGARQSHKEPPIRVRIFHNSSYLLSMIATPPLIPRSEWNALSLAIARRDTRQVQSLVEEHSLNVNAFLDSSAWMPLLMDALLSNSFETEEDRLPLLRYLLDKGANPSICCARGYNCLHIAVREDKYLKALDLFLDYKADVNVVDSDGANVIYWAVQRWLLRNKEADRAEHLRVFDKI